jgi:hypothetical protein
VGVFFGGLLPVRAALSDLPHCVDCADESAAALAALAALAADIAAAATIATIATIATLASAGPAVASTGTRDEQRNWADRWRCNRPDCPCHPRLHALSSPS